MFAAISKIKAILQSNRLSKHKMQISFICGWSQQNFICCMGPVVKILQTLPVCYECTFVSLINKSDISFKNAYLILSFWNVLGCIMQYFDTTNITMRLHSTSLARDSVVAICMYKYYHGFDLKMYVYISKHRKNCECCPGHYLIVDHYSSI